VLGLGVEVALDAVIDEGDEACCDDDTVVIRWEELELDEQLTRRHQ
jgi:hypothetical protein